MPGARQNVPDPQAASENISILLITPHPEDEAAIRQMVSAGASAQIRRCTGIQEALQQIPSISPALVVCERDLPDGNWKAVIGACEVAPGSPVVVVVSQHADENLWAEVLNLGGYDVLPKPFDKLEVRRVVESSCRYWSGSPTRHPAASERIPTPLNVRFA